MQLTTQVNSPKAEFRTYFESFTTSKKIINTRHHEMIRVYEIEKGLNNCKKFKVKEI